MAKTIMEQRYDDGGNPFWVCHEDINDVFSPENIALIKTATDNGLDIIICQDAIEFCNTYGILEDNVVFADCFIEDED